MLRHLVVFQFKEGTASNVVEDTVKSFDLLFSNIQLIQGYERGVNNSTEGMSQGLTHIFNLTFEGEKERDQYLTHPLHVEFVNSKIAAVEKVLVLDYDVTKIG